MVQAQVAPLPGVALIDFNGGEHAAGGFQHLCAPVLPGIGHAEQYALESGPAIAVIAGKVGAAKEGLALRSEHRG